ncbi:MAG: 16S rRNA (guanine(966)-N(2))-methyltransferase RsmD [Elusimicrobia bacterium RIFCSPHIGHO2_02_FULL_57_9]|nr:MAG: 16S rRNA (guanine(966)-N(2))-methyltransferase RsmD [Elusimicrobia bacterium RIFCSPHIGHO2_02_FULL_57_9]
MRIIAGKLRGRRYKAAEDPRVRPVSGRIKQSLFDIIAGLLPGSKVLDLFAGTGAVGIEALSRGAGFVVFVDLNQRCVDHLQANLVKMELNAKAKALMGNALSDLSWLAFRSGVSQFNIIFMGPPYKDLRRSPLAYTQATLQRVCEAGLLAPGGLIICQHHVKEDVSAPPGFKLVRREKYGDSYLSLFKPDGN